MSLSYQSPTPACIAPSVATEAGENKLDYYEPPPPEIPADWDPVSAWLPLAPPATPAAEPSAAHLQHSGSTPSPHSDKPRFGLAAAWGRLKRRFGGSWRAATVSSNGAPAPAAALPAALHTTGSKPLPLPELQPVRPSAPAATANDAGSGAGGSRATRIPRPPPPPAAGLTSGMPGSSHGASNSTPGSSGQQLRVPFADSQTNGFSGSAGWSDAREARGALGPLVWHSWPWLAALLSALWHRPRAGRLKRSHRAPAGVQPSSTGTAPRISALRCRPAGEQPPAATVGATAAAPPPEPG